MYVFIYGACLLSIIILPIISLIYGALSAIFYFQNSLRKVVISFLAIIVWFLAAGNVVFREMSFEMFKWSFLVGLAVAVLSVFMYAISWWVARYFVLRMNTKDETVKKSRQGKDT